MIRVITAEAYRAFERELREMHVLRYRIFKERLGWEVRAVGDEEWDEFDELNPAYVLAFAQGGKLVGSWRLLPTLGPYMLRDKFAELLEGRPAPCDPWIWECSRFVVDNACSGDRSLAAVGRITCEMVAGVLEYCLGRGIREVVSVYDIGIARLYPRIGGRTTWQSRPRRVGNTLAVAGAFEVSEEVLATVRSRAGITESVLAIPADQLGRRAA